MKAIPLPPVALAAYGGGQTPPANEILGEGIEMLLKLGYRVYGVHKSFLGMGNPLCYEEFDMEKARWIAKQPGTYLGMCRDFDPADEKNIEGIFIQLKERDIHLIYLPGGDGSSRACSHLLEELAKRHPEYSLRIIFIPSTIDGIENSDSVGVSSAAKLTAEDAKYLALNAFATFRQGYSTGRVAIVESQGRNRNTLAVKALEQLELSDCEIIFIPAAYSWSFNKLLERVNYTENNVLIIISEGAVPEEEYWDAVKGAKSGEKLAGLIKSCNRKEVNLHIMGYKGQTCEVAEDDHIKCKEWVAFACEFLQKNDEGSFALIRDESGTFGSMPLEEFAAYTNSKDAVPLTETEMGKVGKFLP